MLSLARTSPAVPLAGRWLLEPLLPPAPWTPAWLQISVTPHALGIRLDGEGPILAPIVGPDGWSRRRRRAPVAARVFPHVVVVVARRGVYDRTFRFNVTRSGTRLWLVSMAWNRRRGLGMSRELWYRRHASDDKSVA
jgi:hypothetical protein